MSGKAAGAIQEGDRTIIPRPRQTYKTCTPAALSKQCGWEALLARLEPAREGDRVVFNNAGSLTHHWAAGLLKTVGETAIDLVRPCVVVHVPSGAAFAAVATLGPLVLGWPMATRAAASGDGVLLQWATDVAELEQIFIEDPCRRKGRLG